MKHDQNFNSKKVKATLAQKDIHMKWESGFRTIENERFYEIAFDRIEKFLNANHGSVILDVGCGICAHSVRLAKRGFYCYAVDFSNAILEEAKIYVHKRNVEKLITIQNEDITNLSFDDNSFDFILCWGVLMHIPDLERAVAELSRVLRPEGKIIINENNMYSLQTVLTWIVKISIFNKRDNIKYTPVGIEYWQDTPAGMLLTRQTNINYLIHLLKKNKIVIKKRYAGQFTTIYSHFRNRIINKFIHTWNKAWFRFIRLPQPASANMLFGEKQMISQSKFSLIRK